MTFPDLLARWNGGELRGAQSRLAKRLGVAPNTISQWVTGVSRPRGVLKRRAAKELGLPPEDLDKLFSVRRWREPSAAEGRGGREPLPVFGPVKDEPFAFDFDAVAPEHFLPVSLATGYGGRGAALLVQGNRWESLARDGDYLLLAESSVAVEGRWVLVRREDGCRLRRLASGPARSDDQERVLAVVVGRFGRV